MNNQTTFTMSGKRLTIEFKGIVQKTYELWMPENSYKAEKVKSRKITIFAPGYGEAFNYITVEFKGDNVKLLDGINEQDVVTVTAEVGGFQYNSKKTNTHDYMNSIRGINISKHKR